jgi:ribose-phosphate pyrophosphokinase
MMAPLVLPMPGNETLARNLCAMGAGELSELETRAFPDRETYLRFAKAPSGRSVALIATLADPNEKFLPLLFAARTARELGARRVGLVAPYLGYMRQDTRFHPGEAVTSRHFASLISADFDWLVTIDPHLHRYRALDEIYSIPARALHAAPLLAAWIAAHIAKPFLIGPDVESEQWVSDIARTCGAAYCVLRKERLGDRDVRIAADDLRIPEGTQPMVIDDVISSGRTMEGAVRLLAIRGQKPLAMAVHGLFAENADARIMAAGAAGLVTANTIPHSSNRIDIAPLLAPELAALS